MRAFYAAIVGILLCPQVSLACAVCYGAADDKQTIGLNYAIIALLCVLAVMYGLFIKFFVSFCKKSKEVVSEKE